MLLGVIQAQAAGVAAGSFDLLETQVLASSAASVTFSGLDAYAADYKHLQIRMVAKNSRTGATGGDANNLRINGVSTSSYRGHLLKGNGSSVSSSSESGLTYINIARVPTLTQATDVFGPAVVDILDAFDSAKNTTVRSLSGFNDSTSSSIVLRSGLFLDTSPVSSLEISSPSGSQLTGSRFSIYGIRG